MNNSKLINIFKNYYPIFILLFLSILLCFANYVPGTYLTGWDSLHPEFDFGLNFQRTLFGVFRTEQGLGAVAAHSHMSDLPRIIILYIFHFVLPNSFLRYSYVFLNLIVGSLGMYFLLEKAVVRQKTASLVGAIFYLLNLGTYQTFVVPFEMFTTLYAYLPFIFLYATKFILEHNTQTVKPGVNQSSANAREENPLSVSSEKFITQPSSKQKDLLIFSIFMFLSTPSAYAATLWYVFFICFAIFIISLTFLQKSSAKLVLLLFATTFLINSFWLLPNWYFIFAHSAQVQNANINKLFSEQAFLTNKEFGNLSDILLLKSFYFDWTVYAGAGKFQDLTQAFSNYLQQIPILFTGYIFAAFFISGIFYFLRSKLKEALPYALVLLPTSFFLINDNFPFSRLFNFLQQNAPLFKEALRFPGDKIINIYTFIFTIFFAYGFLFIANLIKKYGDRFLEIIFPVASILLIFIYMLPAFAGNYITNLMKVDIPQDYLRLFSYVKNQNKQGKIASFPVSSPWGWAYYDFKNGQHSIFQGAGFLYFGLSNPLLDRDFDRWNMDNENYYREISYAVYKNDLNLFKNTIQKYDIAYLLVDKNIISIPESNSISYIDQTQRLIDESKIAYKKQSFGKIDIYEIKNPENIIVTKPVLPNINQATSFYQDYAYQNYADYLSLDNILEQNNYSDKIIFPFRDIMDNQFKINKNLVKFYGDKVTFDTNLPVNIYSFDNSLDSISLIPTNINVELKQNTFNLIFNPSIANLDSAQTSSTTATIFPIPSKVPDIISINNKVINVPKLTQNIPVTVKKMYLENSDNYIDLYSNYSKLDITNLINKINPIFAYCDKNKSQTSINAYVLKNGIEVTGSQDICIIIPLSNLIDNKIISKYKEILLDQSFNFQNNASISACIQDSVTNECIYYPEIISNSSNYSLKFTAKTAGINNLAIKLILNNNNQNNKYIISNLSLSINTPFYETAISKETIYKSLNIQNIYKFSKLNVPNYSNELTAIDYYSMHRLSNQCEMQNTVAYKDLDNSNIIKYISLSGTFCDNLPYNSLPHNQGYLVRIESKNESGLPLTLCIRNYASQRCDIFTALTPWKNFDNDVFLLPPMDKQGKGYSINFNNIGIKGSPAVNYIKSIEFIPIPADLIQSIKNKDSIKPINIHNNNNTAEFNQLNPTLFFADIKNNPGLVVLNYSFENGFKAYLLKCEGVIPCNFKTFFAPIFGKQIKQHMLVNGWSNGWILPNSEQKSTVAIIFVPQYLEYLGLLFLMIFLIGLPLSKFITKKNHNDSIKLNG